VARALLERRDYFARQVGAPLVVRRAAVRDPAKPRPVELPPGTITTSVDAVLEDPAIDIIVEVIGGEEPAGTYIRRAIHAGKHVVTANKELIAKSGPELLAEAHARGLDIMFEASVGGGIPLIAPLRRDLLANRISSIRAIINGTTNYILTSMATSAAVAEALRRQGIEPPAGGYEAALAEAQQLGYAEPDPTNDVEGYDAAYKLAIMATLGFRTTVRPSQVHTEGITRLARADFEAAHELGYAIKLLAIAERTDGGIIARVAPAFIPLSEPLARVDGVYNAVQIHGDLTGTVLFQGRGAGSEPTSSAVVADILDLAHAIVLGTRERKYWGPEGDIPVLGLEHLETRYYLRVNVADKPGVLAQIAQALGNHQVSIAAVNQKETDPDSGTADLVIMTHRAREGAMQAALRDIQALPVVVQLSSFLRVEG
ncbi:homoserine dehydrogenase, partial [Tepidiforma sp.]|uniref:homoserine dehydrogenase n=1 Tax=Tepidiforma sp. TaxID=2682230 RepID=UPI002ADD48AC